MTRLDYWMIMRIMVSSSVIYVHVSFFKTLDPLRCRSAYAFCGNFNQYCSVAKTKLEFSILTFCFFSEHMALGEQFEHSCDLITNLVHQREFQDTFSSKINLLPPDLLRTVDNQLKEEGYTAGQR